MNGSDHQIGLDPAEIRTSRPGLTTGLLMLAVAACGIVAWLFTICRQMPFIQSSRVP